MSKHMHIWTQYIYARKQVANASNGSAAAANTYTGLASFVDKMKANNKDIIVFFCSETGTAEEYAHTHAQTRTSTPPPIHTLMFTHTRSQYTQVANASNGSAAAANTYTGLTSFVDKMKANNKDIIVFFGSQTGTAEEFASRLASEAKLYGFNAMTADLEEYEMVCR